MELILKGDEIGCISNHDDQSFGMFCPASAENVFAEFSKLCAENEALRVEIKNAKAAGMMEAAEYLESFGHHPSACGYTHLAATIRARAAELEGNNAITHT